MGKDDKKNAQEQPADANGAEASEDAMKTSGVEEPADEEPADEADDVEEVAEEEASPKRKKEPMSVTRRDAFIGVGATAGLLVFGSMRYAIPHNTLVRPPGGTDESHLVSACIRCEKCYEVCPRGVIAPAHIEDGLLGMRSPMLNFDSDYCDFCQEENGGTPLCEQNCPTRALNLDEGATATNTILGIAAIDTSTCLAYRDTGCRFCYDACPYEAIVLTDNDGNIMETDEGARAPRPVVVEENCVGCGACESVCVSMTAGSVATDATERAILVYPLEDE